MSPSRTGLNWTVVAVFCGLLLAASLVAKEALNDDLRKLLVGEDKILHAVAYGILAVLVCRALARGGRVTLAHVAGGVFLAIGYGALLEVVQGACSDRTSGLLDAGANALGAGSGGVLWFAAAVRGNGSRTEPSDCKS